ncbi:MAG: polysaccharide deacetylase family protein [Patescibacteria group bacterium]|nr:polysaccharide deacetylase family protein [Patescibacteria group bacterium]
MRRPRSLLSVAVTVFILLLSAVTAGEVPGTADDVRGNGRCHALVLLYHRIAISTPDEPAALRSNTVSPRAFAAQMQYLHDQGYPIVSYGQVVSCLADGVPLPKYAIVITFDDGYRGSYRHALPVLMKYGMTATFFVATSVVDSGTELTWEQVKDLDAKGMTIGSHSRSHCYLTGVYETVLIREIEESKRIIESHLGKPTEFFAYPFGDANKRVIEAVRKAGYLSARGTNRTEFGRQENAFMVASVGVGDSLPGLIKIVKRCYP